MNHWLAVALGGAVGAMARYGITLTAGRWAPGFPWGTLVANVLGCFLLGMLAQWALTPGSLDPLYQRMLGVGFLGALTTFSTFGHDTVRLAEEGRITAAMGNLGLNLAVGFAAVWLGIWLVRR